MTDQREATKRKRRFKRCLSNPVTEKYDNLYQAVIDAEAAVERGDPTPDEKELALAWDHASRFAAAGNRYCPTLGDEFLVQFGWVGEEEEEEE